MFQVLENDIPCEYPLFRVHPSWNKSSFDSLQDAIDYAKNWLGVYAPDTLNLNEPYDYNGYGDCLCIIERN
jgi:hypothetical protein